MTGVSSNFNSDPIVRKKKNKRRESEFEMNDSEYGEYSDYDFDSESPSKKKASRRKVEMHWEKKRLRDKISDFDTDF